MKMKLMITLISVLMLAGFASAALVANSTSYTYSQNFDAALNALPSGSGTNNWINDTSINGWRGAYLSSSGASQAPFNDDNTGITSNYGANATAGFMWSLGAHNTSDRALDMYSAASSRQAMFGVTFTNGSGGTLLGFTLGFALEQWSRGSNSSVNFVQYQIFAGGSSATNMNSMTAWNTLWTYTNGATGGAVATYDGNNASYRTTLGLTNSVTWNDGDLLMIRWLQPTLVGGQRSGTAVDDVTFGVIPEPATIGMLGIGALIMFLVRRMQR